MRSLALATAVAATAMTFAAATQARTSHHWSQMTLSQRRAVVVREIQRQRSPVRWWIHTRRRTTASATPLRLCRAIGIRAPGPICVHGQKLVKAIHTRNRIDKAIAAASTAAFLQVADHDFATAARYADRVYPGSYEWLMACSASEGGHGGFVMNHQGSGAGGWMQFMSGTFYGSVGGAFEVARERGYALPTASRSWYSPLGQAVTAAYVRWRYGTGAWTGGRC